MSFTAACLIIFLAVSIFESIYDCLKYRVVLSLIFAGIAALVFCHFWFFGFRMTAFLKESIISTAICAALLITARLLTGGGLGWGDVFFGIFSSFFTGYMVFCFIALGASAVLGLIYYLIFSFTRKKKNGNSNGVIITHRFVLPYIPFMTAGTLITYWLLWINWLNY